MALTDWYYDSLLYIWHEFLCTASNEVFDLDVTNHINVGKNSQFLKNKNSDIIWYGSAFISHFIGC